MKSEWREYLLGDLYNFSSGLSKNSKEFGFGKPFLSFKTVFNNYILPEELPDLVNSNVDEQERCSIMKGDIFLTRTSETLNELGMSSVALRDYPEATFNGFTKRLRPKGKQIYPLYVAYYMRSPFFRANINSMASMTTRASLNNDILSRLPIQVPTYGEQEKIGDILYSFDKKIKLNHRINDNLQEQARSIFQSRFIDYEPFGGSMPSDWKPATLGQIAVMKTDSWSPAKNPDVVVEHYSIPAYDEQRYPVFEIASGIKSNKYLITSDSVMISKLNPDTKRIWRPICLSEHPVCSTEFIVYEAKKKGQRDYIYSLIDSVPFFTHLCSHTTGSTNSRQRATPKSTLDFALCLPPDNVIEDFCQIVTPMYDLIASNVVENQSLAKARDTLLPRLMSGDIDVSSLDL